MVTTTTTTSAPAEPFWVPHTNHLLRTLYAEHEALAPKPGEIAVGGEHMDPLFRYDGVHALRLALDEGKDLATALVAGQVAAAQSVRRWNRVKVRDYHVHRWDGTCDAFLVGVAQTLETARAEVSRA